MMQHRSFVYRIAAVLAGIGLITLLSPQRLAAGGKIGLYGVHMTPYGVDAKTFSRPGWGVGGHVVFPFSETYNLLAGVAGLEYINLMGERFDDFTDVGGARFPYRQETDQHYMRLYLGGEVGGHGNGFFRPHAGMNIALVLYGISTDVVIEDEFDPEKEIRKNQSSVTHGVGGYDITLGLDLNFNNTVAIDVGVRYLKSFSLPEQLGEGSVTIYPQYFQIYIGIGASFDALHTKTGSNEGQ